MLDGKEKSLEDILHGRPDCTIIHAKDEPEELANPANQVAVVWISEDGNAPFIKSNLFSFFINFKFNLI